MAAPQLGKKNSKSLYLCLCIFKLPSLVPSCQPEERLTAAFRLLEPREKWLNSELKCGIHYYTPESPAAASGWKAILVHLKTDLRSFWSQLKMQT